jgi:uncharacterized protein (TIGR03437 family)
MKKASKAEAQNKRYKPFASEIAQTPRERDLDRGHRSPARPAREATDFAAYVRSANATPSGRIYLAVPTNISNGLCVNVIGSHPTSGRHPEGMSKTISHPDPKEPKTKFVLGWFTMRLRLWEPLKPHVKAPACAFVLILTFTNLGTAQAPDFLHPQQKGPFLINGLEYTELGSYTDPVLIGYPVPTLDQIIAEIKATGTNLVKLYPGVGSLRRSSDNAYDPALPFPSAETPAMMAFGQKLASQGIGCYVNPASNVENIQLGSGAGSAPDPADRRAFMAQHIPRLVTLAQMAESAGCEYFSMFNDDVALLVRDPNLVDLWAQAITQVRKVFSGRLTSVDSWGEHGGGYALFPPQLVSMLDVWGLGFFPSYTDHADPTVAELVASYQKNAAGHNSLQVLTDTHTLYQKPILITDEAYGSFSGANLGEEKLYQGAGPFKLDYQEQANLYQAFFQAMPTLDPNWMLGVEFLNFQRYPYQYVDALLGPTPGLGTFGADIRGKPALQTVTQAYQTTHPLKTPANGWWYSPSMLGTFYVIEAENGVVHLGTLAYSAKGDSQWSLVRCVQRPGGDYVGTAEQYTGGWALNQASAPPAGIVDGPAVRLVFNSAATATLQFGTQTVSIQRYQFSDQWASPMLNAPRAGWWDQPTQSGRGYFFEVQGNTLFAGGLIYSSSGQPSWFTSIGPVDSTGAFSGSLTVCSAQANADGSLQAPVCKGTTDTIRLAFNLPWRATLTLGQEAPLELRRYRQTGIGWAGPVPAFPLPKPAFLGQAATFNAASLSTGAAPGSIGTIFGTALTRGVNGVIEASTSPLPFSIHGTSVLVNGKPAPIFAIANINGQEQINFQIPWEAQGITIPILPGDQLFQNPPEPTQSKVSIVVVNNGAVSPALRTPFFDTQPAIITSDGTHAVAVHADYSLVTSQNPARPGDVITLYGIGFGPVTPSPTTGAPAGSSPPSVMNPNPTVSISAQNATLLFACLSPGSVGLYQFNFVVPGGLGIGDLPAGIRVDGQPSNIVFIPVQGQAGVQSEVIRNGSFSAPFGTDWVFYVGLGAVASVDQPASSGYDGNFSAHLSVTTAATDTSTAPAFAGVQFWQAAVPVTQGVTYQLQFWAKSSNARSMRVNVFKDEGDHHSYGLSTTFSLGPDWQHYVTFFQATETAPDGELVFFFGDQTGDVWLEGVSLIAIIGP